MDDDFKPRFREDFRSEYCEGQGLFLYSENDFAILTGSAYDAVARSLNGTLTVRELIKSLDGKVDATLIHYALMQLEKKGYLADARHSACDDSESAFWRLSSLSPGPSRQALRAKTVSIAIVGAIPPVFRDQLVGLLYEHGIDASTTASNADLTVVLTDNYLHPELKSFGQQAREGDCAWLLARPLGIQSWIGPYFDSSSACWSCLAQRLRGHRMVETFLQRKQGLATTPTAAFASTASTRTTALSLLAEEIVRTLAGAGRLRERVVSVEHHQLSIHHHVLTRRAQCPECGDASMKKERAIQLQPCPRNFSAEGGHRSIPPEETVAKYLHHVSPITGVIRELISIRHDGDDVKFIYGAGHNFAFDGDDVTFLRASLRMASGGKGRSDEQAKASAICEALERYSGVFQGDETRYLATIGELGAAAIHPNEFLLFSEYQYQHREESNPTKGIYQFVPEPFDPERAIEWTPLWSLSAQQFRYLPTACCYFGYRQHQRTQSQGIWSGFAHADSNGCAAGNTIEEAIFQGLFELIERDSVACWWYSRCQRPAVDLESFDDPYFMQMVRHYGSLGRDVWVLDVTNDLGIPTFVAVSCRRESDHDELIWGCGTHIDARIGIQRALTEVNQFLAAFDRFSSIEDRYLGFDPEAANWFKSATLSQQQYLVPAPHLAPRRYSDYAPPPIGDLTEELRHCVGKLEDMGLEVLVLDQTRQDVGLPVVRVVVPGMRSFFARHAAGRLYDVPVALGWTSHRLDERALNPIPVFF